MYQINVLIPFNLIIDTEMGLMKLLQYEYHNEEYFYPGLLGGDDVLKRYLLVTRQDRNPLSIIIKEDENIKPLQEELYNQFMEKEYSKILSLSPVTELTNISSILRTSIDKTVKVNILCETDEEIELIKKRKIAYDIIVKGTPETIDIKEYNTLFIKDTKDLDRYNNVDGKVIYVADYEFNIMVDPNNENLLIDPENIIKYASNNEFIIISVYSFEPKDIPLE